MVGKTNAVSGSGGRKKYTVQNDQYNKFYPTEAYPGEYVVTVGGEYIGTARIYDETGTYLICYPFNAGTNLDDLPPKVREVIENAPITRAPPQANSGYLFFVMPEENVKIVTKN